MTPLAAIVVACLHFPLHAQRIDTLAGGGSLDGRPALEVSLESPAGIAIHESSAYVSDKVTNRVYRIDPGGVMRLVAGNGGYGFSGDGGPATDATFRTPVGLAVDRDGNVFICDSGNSRIRRVDAVTGAISTVAGGRYPADRVGDHGPATGALVADPRQVAVAGNGDLYVVERDRVRRVSKRDGRIASLDVLESSSHLTGSIAADAVGTLYAPVFSYSPSRTEILRVDETGRRSVFATLEGLGSLAIDPSGRALYAMTGTRFVRIDLVTREMRTLFDRPLPYRLERWMAVDDDGRVYFSEEQQEPVQYVYYHPDERNQVVVYQPGATSPQRLAGGHPPPPEGPARDAVFGRITGLARDLDGGWLVADPRHSRVLKVKDGRVVTVAGTGSSAWDGREDALATTVPFSPHALAVDPSGNIFVGDPQNGRVFRIDAATGRLRTVFVRDPNDWRSPRLDLLALDPRGALYLRGDRRIKRLDPDGVLREAAGGNFAGGSPPEEDFCEFAGSGDGRLATSVDLGCIQGFGFDRGGDLVFAEGTYDDDPLTQSSISYLRRVRGGLLETLLPDSFRDPTPEGELVTPRGTFALDDLGRMFVADAHRVRRLDLTTGLQLTVAGSEPRFEPGFAGDGGPATAARLSSPGAVALGPGDELVIADTGNGRLRIVTPATREGPCVGPTITTQPASRVALESEDATISVVARVGTGVLRYQWFLGESGDVSTPVPGGTAPTLTLRGDQTSPPHWVLVRDDCGSASSTAARIERSSGRADLAVSLTATHANSRPPYQGAFLATVRNLGPGTARHVTLRWWFVPGVRLESSTGSCVADACDLGTLAAGAEATVSLVTSTPAGAWVRAEGDGADPDLDDNSATAGPPDLATSPLLTWETRATPDPVRVGQPVVVTSRRCNGGLGSAPASTWSSNFPEGTTFDSPTVRCGPSHWPGTLDCTGPIPAVRPGECALVFAATFVPALPGFYLGRTLDVLPAEVPCDAAPPVPLATPDASVPAGRPFVLSVADLFGTDSAARYRFQLATSPDFAPGSTLADTTGPRRSVSLPSGRNPMTLHARAAGVTGCGPERFTLPRAIEVVAPLPALLLALRGAPWVTTPGTTPAPLPVRITNIGGSTARVTFRLEGSVFDLLSRAATIEPGGSINVMLTAPPGSTTAPGVRSDRFVADTPFATSTLPVLLTVAASTPGSTGLPRVDPATVTLDGETSGLLAVTNGGTTPLSLAPTVGPGGAWLLASWKGLDTPLAPGERRLLSLRADPSRFEAADYPLPSRTVLTLATVGGGPNDRVSVEVRASGPRDSTATTGHNSTDRDETALIVPSVVHAEGLGATFVSDLFVANVSPDPIPLELFLTPSGMDGRLAARRAPVALPGYRTLALRDVVAERFGSTALAGALELRAPDTAPLALRSVAAGLPPGGPSTGYATVIPAFSTGSGTGDGIPPLIVAGVRSDTRQRVNVILTETTGTSARVRLRMLDASGGDHGAVEVDVPAAGQTQLPLPWADVEGSLRVEPVSDHGRGHVAALATRIDNLSGSFQALAGRATGAPGAGAPIVIPSIVHAPGAYGTFFTTELSIANGANVPARLHVVYRYTSPDGPDGEATADVTLPAHGSLPFARGADAIVTLLGLPAGSSTAGPLRIEGETGAIAARANVSTPADPLDSSRGAKGADVPAFHARSPEAVGVGATPLAVAIGLEAGPRSRTNLILTEVSGRAATVRIALLDAVGNRLGELTRVLGAWQRLQINDVFVQGFGLDDLRLDRATLLLEAVEGEGRVVGLATVIDNEAANPLVLPLTPPGPP